ncbi:MAG: class I SAM-dependent methyltransferase [Rhodoluna sp.]
MLRKPVGVITRGTTNPNRLRRIDRFICNQAILRQIEQPLIVDLGFGANPTTSIELLERVKRINPKAQLLGVEIDPERVARAKTFETEDLRFELGGFEIPETATFQKPISLIRAMNVLRQYDQSEVAASWSLMQKRLGPGGLIVEGTCDEIGRLASWITLDKHGPKSLTLSFRLLGLSQPAKVAERLPKALIHRNTTGNAIHEFLEQLDKIWQTNSALSVFSPAQRFTASCQGLIQAGWPIAREPKRWRLGELTVAWEAVC